MILFPGGSSPRSFFMPRRQQIWFRKKWSRFFWPQIDPFSPNKSSLLEKIEAFSPKWTHLKWHELHMLFASLQLWQSWRNGGQLMKAHSSKTKRHTQHRKRHLGKNINNISLKSTSPRIKVGMLHAFCMHQFVLGGYLTIEISTTTFFPKF